MGQELGHELTPYEKVREIILDHIHPLSLEVVSLEEACGRVLGEDLVSEETVPPFDNSAMDGFAVRSADLETAADESPVTLAVARQIAAGEPAGEAMPPRSCVRIMTGAPVPPGADAVVPHELTTFSDRAVTFTRPVPGGRNIRLAGGDIRPGDTPLRRAAWLRGPQLAVAATLGRHRLRVARRPRVAIISPGKELVEPREKPGPGQIRNSNETALLALVAESGGLPDARGIIDDSREALRRAISGAIASGADMILSTGGVSAGDFDFVQALAREEGKPGFVFKTTLRPGKPQVLALFDGVPLLGLPGNPAAAIVSFTVFVRPALRKMLGAEPWILEPFPVRFPREFSYRSGRVFMLRARVEPDLEAGGHRLAAAGDQDSSFLASLATANALIELPADRDRVRAGEVFPAYWIHPR